MRESWSKSGQGEGGFDDMQTSTFLARLPTSDFVKSGLLHLISQYVMLYNLVAAWHVQLLLYIWLHIFIAFHSTGLAARLWWVELTVAAGLRREREDVKTIFCGRLLWMTLIGVGLKDWQLANKHDYQYYEQPPQQQPVPHRKGACRA